MVALWHYVFQNIAFFSIYEYSLYKNVLFWPFLRQTLLSVGEISSIDHNKTLRIYSG